MSRDQNDQDRNSQTETAQTKSAQTKSAQTESARPKSLVPWSILWKVLSKFQVQVDVVKLYFVNLKAGLYIYFQANH